MRAAVATQPKLRALPFFAKLVPLFFATYAVWGWIEPFYIEVLAAATRVGIWLTELSSDPLWHTGTTILTRDTAIFYTHRNFAAFSPPIPPQGIPAEWVMANAVLLIPLMLATPAPTWRARFVRLGIALGVTLVLQVLDLVVAIKLFYAATFRGYWSAWSLSIYQFLDAFFQSFDTQLFPFAVWAGVHFRQLLALARPDGQTAEPAPAAASKVPTRAERRRTGRKE